MDIELKSLIGKLNDVTRQNLEGAAGLCVSRTNYQVEIEHWLMKLLEENDTDLSRALRQFEIDPSRVESELTGAIDKLKTGNARATSLSPSLVNLVRQAWLFASIQHNAPAVRTAHLLVSLLAEADLARLIHESSPSLARIDEAALRRQLPDIMDGTVEDVATAPTSVGTEPGKPSARPTKTPGLDQYTINLTHKAKSGDIDPVIGRDFEIRQLIDILMRRRQNNPILTGEAGVGKTAVVEGFARRIAQGDVPPPLQNVDIRTLDLGLLQAGAGIKGEFENRLKTVINEVKSSAKPIVLFIDEAHTMIGAGAQAGAGDAANLLKPALARGELRTIAATTWSEYKKYFEKDAALARRFQVVKVEEPSEAKAVEMMRGLVEALEQHHKMRVLDEALEDAVRLSHRYITGRQLPDKAVSVLDTACARVAVGQGATPAPIEDAHRQIDQLTLQIRILKREEATGVDHTDALSQLASEKEQAEAALEKLEERWKQEGELVAQVRDIYEQLEQHTLAVAAEERKEKPPAGDDAPKKLTADQLKAAQADLERLNGELEQLQGETPLMQVSVDSQTIAEVISGWTGIPVGKMLTDEIRMVSMLQDTLAERIIGQSHALEAISKRIQTARAELVDPRRPIGVFLLVGPSGVGKTETALALAETLFGGERNIVSINMSEYQEAHTVSGLKGSPPGYVGYGEGGVLTEAVRRKPYCVVLLDEIEKAHQDVMELFYQVFDKGVLEDGEGRVIDFKNTVILLTSNVGSDLIQQLCDDPESRPGPDQLAEALRPELLKEFKPAFLGRMNVVPYFSLSDDVMTKIVHLQLGRIASRLSDNHKAQLDYDEAVVEQILSRCHESETGARNVDHILTGTLLPEVSREILAHMGENRPISRVQVSVSEGDFAYLVE